MTRSIGIARNVVAVTIGLPVTTNYSQAAAQMENLMFTADAVTVERSAGDHQRGKQGQRRGDDRPSPDTRRVKGDHGRDRRFQGILERIPRRDRDSRPPISTVVPPEPTGAG